LKTIPIVKSSSLDSLYEGLPVVIVQEWVEILDPSKLSVWEDTFKALLEAGDSSEWLNPWRYLNKPDNKAS